MKVTSAVSVIVAFLAAMTGFVYLSIKGIDTTAYVAFVGVTLLPQAMLLFRGDKTQTVQTEIRQDVETIMHRTNGPLDSMAATLQSIDARLKQLEGRVNGEGSS